jgi:ferric-dicitrate binding protein FerR (iron transport regulator)
MKPIKLGRRQFITTAAATLAVVSLTGATPGGLEEDTAGTVSRIQGSAIAIQDALPRILKTGTQIQLGDVISTGPDSRLELKMIDDTIFTLGARTHFVVMEYEFKNTVGSGAVRLMSGALNTITGKLAMLNGAPLKVETNFGTIGIRGTEFWMGSLQGDFEVVMWEGAGVEIRNRAGDSEILQANDGVRIDGPDTAPRTAEFWELEKRLDAMATVTFR